MSAAKKNKPVILDDKKLLKLGKERGFVTQEEILQVFPKPEERKLDVAEDYKLFFVGRARSIEAALTDGREWLTAGRFTVADICIGYAVMLALTLGLKDELGPDTLAWWGRLSAREGFLAARARQGEGGLLNPR